jgi:hypothetical protein
MSVLGIGIDLVSLFIGMALVAYVPALGTVARWPMSFVWNLAVVERFKQKVRDWLGL